MLEEFILLKRKDLRPKKRLGQHFLYDPAIASKIVEAADLERDQVVVELGAGRGILTDPLSQRCARVIALEVDSALCDELRERLGGHREGGHREGGRPEREHREGHVDTAPPVEILNVDFTKISLTGLLAARDLDHCVLIGNIPYNLTREVLFSFLVDEYEVVDSAFLMLQKEVGARIVSPPGSRVYGITSVVLQSLYSVGTVLKVAPGSFSPKPSVASVVLSFSPLPEPLVSPEELKYFIKFVRNLFQQRRKTIHNTMKASYELSEASLREIQAAAEVSLQHRPEELSNRAFLRLSRSLAEVTKV